MLLVHVELWQGIRLVWAASSTCLLVGDTLLPRLVDSSEEQHSHVPSTWPLCGLQPYSLTCTSPPACLLLQNDMESLEQIQGMPPGMYHRYGVLDDDMEDEEDDSTEHAGDFGSAAGANNGSGGIYNADLLVAGMAGLEVDDPAESSADGANGVAAGAAAAGGAAGEGGSVAAESAAAGRQGTWSLMAHPGECPGSTRASMSSPAAAAVVVL